MKTYKTPPNWLSKEGTSYWRKHIYVVDIKPEQLTTFAVLCETYADYRNSVGMERKRFLELYVKLAQQFRLTPKTEDTKKKPANHSEGDIIDNLI